MPRPRRPFDPSTDDQIVLGIETSCDETAAAVVLRRARTGDGRILASVVRSQWEQHRPYGGVVPEIAARAHVECLDDIIRDALAGAQVPLTGLSAVAASAGPGLVGGLLVGLLTAKTLALAHGLDLIGVNHLEAHALTVGLTQGLRPPYLLLLVSGGHTQLLHVQGVDRYLRLGTTIDDALGEAFDKTAKLLGLGQPGGPAVEGAAARGDRARFALPRPMLGRDDANFSFAGLKTAVRTAATAIAPLRVQDVYDLAAGFQAAVADTVADRVRRAMALIESDLTGDQRRTLVVAGGVAANMAIRAKLEAMCAELGWGLAIPPVALCSDNAAMVAWAGAERRANGLVDGLAVPARARWPLDRAAAPLLGSGRAGGKA